MASQNNWITNVVPKASIHNCSDEVLVTVENKYGRLRVLKAVYFPHHNATVEDMGWNMYDGVPDNWEYYEEEDTWWIPQGWYEIADNFEEYSYASIEGKVIAWMELPQFYKNNKLWCSENNCNCYDKKTDTCTRIGLNGKKGICWMERSEGEY